MMMDSRPTCFSVTKRVLAPFTVAGSSASSCGERHLCTVWRKLNSGDVKI